MDTEEGGRPGRSAIEDDDPDIYDVPDDDSVIGALFRGFGENLKAEF